jgi:hypothetical protein
VSDVRLSSTRSGIVMKPLPSWLGQGFLRRTTNRTHGSVFMAHRVRGSRSRGRCREDESYGRMPNRFELGRFGSLSGWDTMAFRRKPASEQVRHAMRA